MYRDSEEYDRMAKLAISIIVDYGITAKDYPLDLDNLCRKMKINVVPYSAFEDEDPDFIDILLKKSKDGFFAPRSSKQEATIFFNDKYGDRLSPSRISQTKGHEIKHIVEEDEDDSDDNLCEYFSKYLRCPIPYVLYLGLESEIDIISRFSISYQQSEIVLSNIINRKRKYGNGYFRYEIELLESLLEDFNQNEVEIID
jgi:hypothetical protein